jgi:Xaa-Pro aminopeptidase
MIKELMLAEKNAAYLFQEAERRNYITPGQTEKQLNSRMYALAETLFGIKKYWHKRIVRSGANTLLPYRENPPDLTIQENDILFFDFGPVFDEWEADFGRTYVIGNDRLRQKLQRDVETAFYTGREFYEQHKASLTGAAFYAFTRELAVKMGWTYGNAHCGHLIGNFPHEEVLGEEVENYLHPDNHTLMSAPDKFGNKRHWIYEIHFVDQEHQIGGFFEQLLSEQG